MKKMVNLQIGTEMSEVMGFKDEFEYKITNGEEKQLNSLGSILNI